MSGFNFNRFNQLPGTIFLETKAGHNHVFKFLDPNDDEVIAQIRKMSAMAREDGTTLTFTYSGAEAQGKTPEAPKPVDEKKPEAKKPKKPKVDKGNPAVNELAQALVKAMMGQNKNMIYLTQEQVEEVKELSMLTGKDENVCLRAYIKAKYDVDKAREILSKEEND